jgi:hypothetical protein
MIRRMLIGGITSLMLIGLPSLGHAQVSVSIGINLPLRSWYPFRRLRSCTHPVAAPDVLGARGSLGCSAGRTP